MKTHCAIALTVIALVLCINWPAAGQTEPAQTASPTIQANKLVTGMSESIHQMIDSVLAYPGVSDVDKEKLFAMRKEFDAGIQKILDGIKDQHDWMPAYAQVELLMKPACKFVQDRMDLYWISLRATQITMTETALLQSTAWPHGKPDIYLEALDAVSMDENHRTQTKAIVNNLQTKLTAELKIANDPVTSDAEKRNAMSQFNDLAVAARKQVRAALTAEQNRDLDWVILQKYAAGKGSLSAWLVFSTFTNPVNAPEDGNYSLKSGDMKSISNTVATVTLKKGQPLGFRTVDKTRKAYAGDKEFPLPDPLPSVILWQFDGAK